MKEKENEHQRVFTLKRKQKLLGIIIMAIAVAIGISILTFRSEDYAIIKSTGFFKLLDVTQGPALRIQNGLGPLGAYISYFFVRQLFGFMSMLLIGIMMFTGWTIFRHRPLSVHSGKILYVVFVMLLLSSIFGWLHNEFDLISANWSGASGVAIAYVLRSLTGQFGPIIILGSLSSIAVLLLLKKEMSGMLAPVKNVWNSITSLFFRKSKENEQQDEKSPATENGSESADKSGDEEAKKKRWERLVSESRDKETSKRKEEEMPEDRPPRAVLEKEKSEPEESEQDLDIKVYRGRPDEEAGSKELERERKKQVEKPMIKYTFPTLDLLDKAPNEGGDVDYEEINQNKMIILDKLNRHGIDILAIEAVVGPTVTLYELQPAPDVKISKIESYANDLKMAMATKGLRIIAPIPGKSAVGIEVPNKKKEVVYIRSLINTRKFAETTMALPVAFGRTIENEVFMVDLARLPHLLMAGATGSGKTVGINTIITCLLYKCHPDDLKFVMVDPKKIELSLFRNIQNHFLATLPNATEPIITDTSEVLQVLNSVCKEMDSRYELLKMGMVRDIVSYNKKFKSGVLEEELGHRYLPYIVVIIDELADLMMTAGKQIEEPIARLAQLARAVGIHLVVATQRPSVNVITGTIKANFPARIAYQVASKIDSRTILDTMGADQLVGRGDMLYNGGGAS
ncbi:DNA translocase FtsK, partial [Balneolaceae bacterium ANBcel3]|nr:DNA translocase FtsK [Balneolaceae bacterium ANBcel3]